MNGFAARAPAGGRGALDVANAIEHYPDSPFARFYRPRVKEYRLDMTHVRDLPAADLATIEDPIAAVDWNIPGAPRSPDRK
jgi:hypothetical protein